ncbi:MAG: tetratricopeptide repeat protein [Candidatus Tritonobacter lacicola]|nr:tetratricopeptide repeat protein [Candidatus Tritonobacter lacicola]
MKRRQEITICACIFGVAFIIRLVYILQLRTSPYFDFPILDLLAYHDWALRIARGDWLGQYVFRQAPLYPYILALFYKAAGPDLLMVRVIQIVMGSLSCVLIYRLGAACFGEREGVIAGILSCCYAPFIFYDGMIMKTSLGIFLNLLLVLLLLKRRPGKGTARLFGAGIILGLSALVKENMLILAPILALWLALSERKVRPAALLLAGVIIVTAPVTARNYVVGRDFVPIACNFGFTLYSGNNPSADGTQQPPAAIRRTPRYEYPDYKLLAERATGKTLKPSEVSAFWAGQATKFAKTYPLSALKLLALKLALFWNSYEIADNHNLYFFKTLFPVLRAAPLGFGIIGPLGLFGMVLFMRNWRKCLVLYLFILSYMVSVVIFYVSARFRLPAVPFLILFASASLVTLYDWLRDGRWRYLIPALASLAILCVIVGGWRVCPDYLTLYPPIRFDAEYYNLGETYNKAGQPREALATYRKAIEINPMHAAAYNNLGSLYDSLGKKEEAIESFRSATRINPGYSLAHYNLALALLKSGYEKEAAKEIELSIKTDPGYVDPHFKLGLYYNTRGKPDRAVAEFRKALSGHGDRAVIHDNIGTIFLEQGKTEEAFREFTMALRANPLYAEGHNKLGILMARAGDQKGAARLFRKAITLDPLNAMAYSNLGSSCLQRERTDEAIVYYKKAVKIDPELKETYELLAIAYQRKGDMGTASGYRRKALEVARRNKAGNQRSE